VDPNREVPALIATLLATSQRLELLTDGQVDTVTGPDGRTFVLRGAQEQMRQWEAVNQAAILDALPVHIALLDGNGNILTVNAAWRDLAVDNALLGSANGVGSNYLAVCDAAIGADVDDARRAAQGIRDVLECRTVHFSLEYSCDTAQERRWFRLHVTPLTMGHSQGAVVMHQDVTTERRAEASLLVSELHFRQLAENIRDVFFLRDAATGETLYVSAAYEEVWGRSCQSLYADSHSWSQAIHPDDRAQADAKRRQGLLTGKVDVEYRIVRPDGSTRWIESRGFPVRDDRGHLVRIAGIAADITERKEAQFRIGHLNRVYEMLTGIHSLIVRAGNRDELFVESCRVAVEDGGFSMAWIGIVDRDNMRMVPVASAGAGTGFLDDIPDFSLRDDAPLGQSMTARAIKGKRSLVSNDSSSDPQALLGPQHPTSGIRSLAVLPLIVADEAVGVLALYAKDHDFFHSEELKLLTALARDIAFAIDHIDKQDRLDYLAYYDVLTGLANRALFRERVAQYMRSAVRDGHRLALFVVDLERFKNINDSLGQISGDALLRQVAEWLTSTVGDASLVARVGADHFAVVLPEIRPEGDIARLVEKAVAAFMAHSFQLNDVSLRVATKVGVAIFPDDGTTADTLFRNAETALKKAKASGDRYMFYAAKMSEAVAGSLTLENQLRQALDKNEFLLFYQPKVNLQTGKLTGAEALIRWNDPRTGLVPPGNFIPILEETGLIHEVGRWALRRAIQDYHRWRAAGLAAVPIAVNVSPLQVRHRGFIADVRQALGADPDAAAGLELEVTESLIMEDAKNGSANLQAIRAMGIRIAIDDFGTGFSSLGYLAKLPVDALKIDRSFVTDMTASQEGLALVSTIITLAHSLKLKVVAEGVETTEQSRLLRLLNCDEMQGYLFSKPLPCADFEAAYLRRPLP
jgi:diguanylate cyclase (GGDEF)-like protein/PAS domain S-box-containing protein